MEHLRIAKESLPSVLSEVQLCGLGYRRKVHRVKKKLAGRIIVSLRKNARLQVGGIARQGNCALFACGAVSTQSAPLARAMIIPAWTVGAVDRAAPSNLTRMTLATMWLHIAVLLEYLDGKAALHDQNYLWAQASIILRASTVWMMIGSTGND